MNTATISSRYFPYSSPARETFQTAFDRKPFPFFHSVHESELFSWPVLTKLAARAEAKSGGYYFESGTTAPGEKWRGVPEGKSLVDVLASIGDSNSLIMLKRVQEYEEYRAFLNTCMDELGALCNVDLKRTYRDPVMTILITSPARVTPYHIDGEANFLLQIQGSKTVHIFNGDDSEVLTDIELEKFWSGEDTKAPKYREHLEAKAWRFEISTGTGVSNPVIFPHWVENGPDVSVSLSINFKRVVDTAADAHRVNHALRKMGLHPRRPGDSPALDSIKSSGYRAARSLKRLVSR
jgi:hypothetical protein